MPGTKNTAHPDTNSHIGMCSFSIEPSEKRNGKMSRTEIAFLRYCYIMPCNNIMYKATLNSSGGKCNLRKWKISVELAFWLHTTNYRRTAAYIQMRLIIECTKLYDVKIDWTL